MLSQTIYTQVGGITVFLKLACNCMCCVYVCCRNDAVAHYTALSSTPSSVASAATLLASECSGTPHADVVPGEAKVKDGSEESWKMSDSELEELYAKYGGYMRAKRAATIIQQTYRQYSMSRSFAKLRLEAGESRRSQRFARRRGLDGCHQDSIDVDRSLNLSQLCDVKIDDNHLDVQQARGEYDQPRLALDAGTVNGLVPDITVVKSHLDEFQGHNDLEDCDDHSGSSRSLSPTLPPPLPAPSDLPSVYFESSLEDETDCRQHSSSHNVHDDCMFTVCSTSHPLDRRECPSSYFQHRPRHCYFDGLDVGVCRHRISHRVDHRTPSHMTTRHSDPTFRPLHIFPAVSSSFARFGLLSEHAEPSPIWKRKSGSVESYDAGVGTSSEEWDVDMARSGRTDRPWSELYPGSTTSSEDTGSIGSGDAASHHSAQNHHYHTTVDHINHSVNSTSSNRSSVLSSSSDRQRKRSYRIGLNLFNR